MCKRVFFFFLIISGIALGVSGLTSAEKIDCLECHKDISGGKVVHAAVQMGCEGCHTGVDASDIPHKFKGKKGLSAELPDLCFTCHEKGQFTKKDQHPPVSAGMCLSCHFVHSGPYVSLLTKQGNQLCSECHKDIEKKPHLRSGTLPQGHALVGRHDPIREGKPFGCVSCHVPHSSDWGKLYRYEATNPTGLCKNCHGFMQ
jgi:predicted CXXCH cytochrome family protein